MKLASLLALWLAVDLPRPATFGFHLETPGECRIFFGGGERKWGTLYESEPFIGVRTLTIELRYGDKREVLVVEIEAGYRKVFGIRRAVGREEKAGWFGDFVGNSVGSVLYFPRVENQLPIRGCRDD